MGFSFVGVVSIGDTLVVRSQRLSLRLSQRGIPARGSRLFLLLQNHCVLLLTWLLASLATMVTPMSVVVVERSFGEAALFEELEAAEGAVSWCLKQYDVRPIVSYLSADGLRMLCIYEAPDAEAVKGTQDRGDLPYDHIWSSTFFGNGLVMAPGGRETVVTQRAFEPPVGESTLKEMAMANAGCMRLYRVDHEYAALSLDGRRQFCLHSAPDTEAVRTANRVAKVEGFATWKASVHPAR
jgi:hypothetical protein